MNGAARGGPTAAAARLQGALVAVQVALSLMLLTGAGLFVRTLQQGLTQDYGFPVTDLALLASTPLFQATRVKPPPPWLER